MASEPIDWSAVIYKGAETDELDYKAAQNWNELSRGGRAKFVRHCLAMANTKGGYIVVGVGEDSNGRPVDFTGLTEEQSKSFDPTTVGNFISRFSDPPVDFTLERPVVDGKCYAVFAVKPFRDLPHVCPSNCEDELLRGVFYIRTKDASSRPAYRATELHSIIQRALRNQREMLGRMLRGILYENNLVSPEDPSGSSFFSEELLHSRMFFNKRNPDKTGLYQMEFFVIPEKYKEDRNPLPDLRNAAEEAFSLYPEPGPLTEFYFPDNYFTNTSFRGFNETNRVMMQLWRSGMIHFIGNFPLNDSCGVPYRQLSLFLSRAVVFAARYYAGLGYTEEMLSLNFRMDQSENMILSAENGVSGKCRIPEVLIRQNRTASDLASGWETHAARLLQSVSERFNFEPSDRNYFTESVRRSLVK